MILFFFFPTNNSFSLFIRSTFNQSDKVKRPLIPQWQKHFVVVMLPMIVAFIYKDYIVWKIRRVVVISDTNTTPSELHKANTKAKPN